METTSLAVIVGSVLGAGGLAGVIPAWSQSRRAAKQQPVDQYDKLVSTMQLMLKQERDHCEQNFARLAEEHRQCTQGQLSLTNQLGELSGRLEEQRHMLAVAVASSKQNTETIALMGDAGTKGKR